MANQEQTRYLIIGGGLAGGNAASEIRKQDKQGRLILISREDLTPYDRVPLSKAYLTGKIRREALFLKKPEFYTQNGIELMLGRDVSALDAKGRTATLLDGTSIKFEKLLLASGGAPRRIPLPGAELPGIYYLRTVQDCDAIKSAAYGRAAVLGGGFIGCELASAFASMGLECTIIEMGPFLLNMAVDEETGRWVGDYFTKRGVRVLLNTTAKKFLGGEGGSVRGVETNGSPVDADFVVVGVGISLNTALAEGGGLKVERGIVTNEFLETSVEGIYAAGDVARFYSPVFGRHLRLEHYDVAVKHGRVAGRNMVADRPVESFLDLPYFFSYQFDLKINAYGDLSSRTSIVRRGELNATTGFMQFYFNGNLIDGVLTVNTPSDEIKKAKNLVQKRTTLSNPREISDGSRDLGSF